MNKILIIDDDRELCALIKRSVQAENIEADFCNTGKEGLQKLREQEYQLVVLDVMMPGMDGFETLEEIRKENSLPILMFTSKNDSISKVRGLRAGADDYLTKPFDMDELIARIASLIRRYTRFNQQAGAIQKLNFDGLQIDLENRSVTTANGTFELPPKEFDLLLYCAKHQGKILTKQQIYEEVHFSLSQDVIIPPAVKAVEIFDLRPVLGKPVPGNDLFPMKIRSSDLYVEFSQPLAFCSCSSVFLQCAGCGILCSSKRRNIKIPDIKSFDLFRKKFRFLPALFGQGIYCVIRVSMSYKK